MSIRIIKPGVMTTLQDTGRKGYRHNGIGTGGAMDRFALPVANYLVGNEENAAVMEMGFPAPEILFGQNAIISLCGADFTAFLNDQPLPIWKPVYVKKDAVLRFGQPVSGNWAYLAVQGGWNAEKWLGSFSTNQVAVAGGHLGRSLQKDDEIRCREDNFSMLDNAVINWQLSDVLKNRVYASSQTIRCITGIEWDMLSEESKLIFTTGTFGVGINSDRMGLRMEGPNIDLEGAEELISSIVDSGTVQLLPDGRIVILMADHQTSGGYPRIASVIRADQPRLAQMKPGEPVRFSIISLPEAENALISMEQLLKEIKAGCHLNFEKFRKQ